MDGCQEYALVRRLLAPLEMPLFVIPGNHDDRSNLRSAFNDHAYLPGNGGFIQYVTGDYPLRMIGPDTTIPGKPGGELCAQRLA